MDQKLLQQEITRFEGCKYEVYLDSLGLKTAGIGHLLIGAWKDAAVGTPVSANQVDQWYQSDAARSTYIAQQILGDTFAALDENRQRMIVALCFNMGNRLAQFVNFLAALKAGDYDTAANELQNSKWYGQVGQRGPITCDAIRNGYYS